MTEVDKEKWLPTEIIMIRQGDDEKVQKMSLPIHHFHKAEYTHDKDGKNGAERLRLDLWSGCDSYDDFEPIEKGEE